MLRTEETKYQAKLVSNIQNVASKWADNLPRQKGQKTAQFYSFMKTNALAGLQQVPHKFVIYLYIAGVQLNNGYFMVFLFELGSRAMPSQRMCIIWIVISKLG